MTNANEMAQKGFDTGFTDANDNELHVGDYVRICSHIGKIVFSCGAFGIFIADEVPWDALEELVRKDSGNRPSFLYNDTFISFWEIVWNLSEDTDEPCLPYVESITATGGIFTDENGNKDVFMGCINGCSATLTQCEYTCGHNHGEQVTLSISEDGIIERVWQDDHRVRVEEYDKEGYHVGESYDGRWTEDPMHIPDGSPLDKEVELSDAQLQRNDDIYAAVTKMCRVLTENNEQEFNMSIVGPIADYAAMLLTREGNKVRFPSVVQDTAGHIYIENYYDDGEVQAI